MSNLFSSFDPAVRLFSISISINWISCSIIIFIFPQLYWILGSQITKTLENLILYIEDELLAVFSNLSIPGTVYTFLVFFLFIIFSNFIGLFPYIFTSTRHITITLTLALPIWLGRIVWSIFYQYNNLFAHLVPTGTPGLLIPVIVIIETVRNIIRPGTLSVRLGANIIAGHLLLTLLGSQGPSSTSFVFFGLIVSLILLLILELGVACIQAYVFTILRSLYLNELLSISFNKVIVK